MTVSKFWNELGEEHRRDLEQYGYGNIKRRQAFRYFNWSWRWRSLGKSEQWKFLYRNTSPDLLLRCALAPPVLGNSEWMDVPLGRADRLLYTVAVRMLWEYAATNDRLGVLGLAEPALGNPVPVHWRGRLISQDLANTSLEVNALARSLAYGRGRNILEIGAGYGRTAYALLSLWPDARYTIVDIEPALSISRWYLTTLFPNRTVTFIHADNASAELSGTVEPFDVALSISSLQEMRPDQIAKYLQLIDDCASDGIVFLKQWRSWYNNKDEVTVNFADFPIPKRWGLCFTETAPVQTNFDQSCWRIPKSGS